MIMTLFGGNACAETIIIAGHQFYPADMNELRMKRGGGRVLVVYDKKNDRFVTPVKRATRNPAVMKKAIRAIAAANAAGNPLAFAYDGALYWADNPIFRSWTYCRLSRHIATFFDQVKDYDC
jgi:hypothetical protein